jgi:hypothetical protein
MVINIDSNVVYGILVAIVLIILILETPRILRSRRAPDSDLLKEDPAERTTEQWRRDDPA